MAINPLFDTNYNNETEQDLLEGLIIESIQTFGIDTEYIFRDIKNFDKVYDADTISEYREHQPIEVYVESFDGFTGDQTFLSKFGLEVRDELTVTVAQKRWEEEFDPVKRKRPQEGDLIWFPFGKRLFYIKNVEHRPFFYQMGKLFVYTLTCELFEYSSQKLDTGIPEIDIIEDKFSLDTTISGSDDDFDIPLGESADNDAFSDEDDALIDFSETNPFGKW